MCSNFQHCTSLTNKPTNPHTRKQHKNAKAPTTPQKLTPRDPKPKCTRGKTKNAEKKRPPTTKKRKAKNKKKGYMHSDGTHML
mmetsp:Transcript_20223/g.40826  ORF Transcript_20223/g.40826 Transcript_20223/m.40826 type:complete len:83 (-) Transcript_20223:212-460(-)